MPTADSITTTQPTGYPSCFTSVHFDLLSRFSPMPIPLSAPPTLPQPRSEMSVVSESFPGAPLSFSLHSPVESMAMATKVIPTISPVPQPHSQLQLPFQPQSLIQLPQSQSQFQPPFQSEIESATGPDLFFTNDNTADDGNRTTIPVLQPLPDNFSQLQPNGHNVNLGLGHTTIDAGDDKDDTIVGDTRHTGPEIINSMSLAVGLPDEDGRLSMDFTRFISEIDSAVGTIAASPGQQPASAVTLPIPIKKPIPTEMQRRRPRCKSRQLYLLEYDREDDSTAYNALLKGWESARIILQESPSTEFNHQEGSKRPQQKHLLVQAAPLLDGSITYTNASWISQLIPPWPPPEINPV